LPHQFCLHRNPHLLKNHYAPTNISNTQTWLSTHHHCSHTMCHNGWWYISLLVRSVHAKRITIWCLQKFPCNTLLHVQNAYSMKGKFRMYMTLRWVWLLTFQTLTLSSLSKVGRMTSVCAINLVLYTFVVTSRWMTLFLMNSHFFIFAWCM
jgi:hypothetical protein